MRSTLPPPAGGPEAISCNWEDWPPYIEDDTIPDAQILDLADALSAAVLNSNNTTTTEEAS